MEISTLSETELKALFYDQLKLHENTAHNMQLINAELDRRSLNAEADGGALVGFPDDASTGTGSSQVVFTTDKETQADEPKES